MNNNHGTALLSVIVIVMIASFYAIRLIKVATYMQTLSSERAEHIKHLYATELLLSYAVTWYQQEKENNLVLPLSINIQSWPPPEGTFQAIITAKKQKKAVLLSVDLLEKNKKVCCLEQKCL